MRVTFFTTKYNFEGGGSTPEMDTKVRALIKAGHSVQVVTLFSSQNRPFSVPYPVLTEEIGSPRLVSIQKGVFQFLKKYEPSTDVFEVEGQFAYGSGLYRRLGGKPILVHFNRELSSFPATRGGKNSFSSLKHRLRFSLEKWLGFPLINWNDVFTFTSPVLLELYVSLGLSRQKSHVMPDFFSVDEMVAEAKGSIADSNSRKEPKSEWQIFTTGRMVPEKGFDVFIQALSRVKSNHPFKVIVSGDGPELEKLKKMTVDLNLTEKVTFTGWSTRTDLINYFLSSDIFVVPRWRPELSSLLALQAMSFGLPMIVAQNTAIGWQAGRAAESFIDEDPDSCAKAISTLLNSPDKRVELSQAARKRAEELDYAAHYLSLSQILESLKK